MKSISFYQKIFLICTLLYLVLFVGATGHWGFGPVHFEVAPGLTVFWLDKAWGWFVALTFVFANVGLGYLSFRLPFLQRFRKPSLWSLFTAFTLGTFGTYTVLLFLSLAKAIASPLGYFVLFFCLGIGLGEFIEMAKVLWKLCEKAPVPSSKRLCVYLLLAFVCLCPYLLETCFPHSDWDAAVYHLPLPQRFLDLGFWSNDPIVEHFNFAGAIHLFYAFFLSIDAVSAIIPFSFIMGLGLILLTYTMGKDLVTETVGLWAAFILASNLMLWQVAVSPRVDHMQALYSMMAVEAFLLWRKEGYPIAFLFPVGPALGILLGIKFTAIIVFGVLGVSFLLVLFVFARHEKIAKWPLWVVLFLSLFPSSLWYIRNAIVLKNPIYAYFSGYKFYDKEGTLQRIDPTLDRFIERKFTPEKWAAIQKGSIAGFPFDTPTIYLATHLFYFWEYFFYPLAYAPDSYIWVSPFILLFLILPLFLRDPPSLWIYFLGMTMVFPIAYLEHVLRYTIFVLPLFALGSGMLLARLRPKWLVYWTALLLGSVLLYIQGANCVKMSEMAPQSLLKGEISTLTWLTEAGYGSATSMPKSVRWINHQIRTKRWPADKTIFLFCEAKTQGLLCPYLPDSSRQGIRWISEILRFDGDLDAIAASFRERGIALLYIDIGYFQWLLQKGRVNRAHLACSLYYLTKFLQKHTELIQRDDVRYIYKMNPH